MVGGELRDEDDMLDPVSQADQNIFAMGEATNAHRYTGEAQDTTPKATSPTPSLLLEGRQQLNKKTRQQRQQCSSVRQTSLPPPKKSSASESHTTDNHYSSSDSRRLGDISPRDQQEAMLDEWEQVMWESAAVLSNIPPSPSFVAHRQDRDRRDVRREVGKYSCEFIVVTFVLSPIGTVRCLDPTMLSIHWFVWGSHGDHIRC